MSTFRIGVQLYTLRDAAAHDLPGVLRAVAALGYEGVEFAGLHGHAAPAIRALLDELGLAAAACHVGAPALEGDADAALGDVATLGAKYAVVPWVDPATAHDEGAWLAFASRLEGWAERARAFGLRLAYHNHVFEFDARHGGAFALDLLFDRAPNVLVELDVAWAHAGGASPVDQLRRHAGRVPLVHVKDVDRAGDPWRTVELGRGEVPLLDVLSAAREAGAEWLIVEQDQCQRDPLQSVEASLAWLRQDLVGG